MPPRELWMFMTFNDWFCHKNFSSASVNFSKLTRGDGWEFSSLTLFSWKMLLSKRNPFPKGGSVLSTLLGQCLNCHFFFFLLRGEFLTLKCHYVLLDDFSRKADVYSEFQSIT